VTLTVIQGENKPNPTLHIESRPPSSIIPYVSFWLVMTYKDKSWERMLPPNFMGMDENEQNLTVLPLAGGMRRELRPILEAEDDSP
jgi:hypothetical protein